MRETIIDMSQVVLNRTAMYTVSMDTREVLADCCAGVQMFGRRVGRNTPLAECRDDARRLHSMLDLVGAGQRPAPISAANPRTIRTLYLDPLYTLFAPLTRKDVVMLLDLSPATNPDWHSSAVSRAYRFAFELIAGVRPRVIAISQSTAEAYRVNYGFPQSHTTVVPLYLPRHLETEALPTFAVAPYFLCVGSLEKRKNLLGALKTFQLSGLAERGYELLVVGGRGHGSELIEALAAKMRGARLMGYVSNQQLASLYAGAVGFLYPSYLEGFGVPLVEAMAAGLPCVASCTGAAPELGGDLVRYADPDDHEAFAGHLIEIARLDDAERARLAVLSQARIRALFSFERYRTTLRAALSMPVT